MNSNDGQLHERLAKLEAQASVLKVGLVLVIGLMAVALWMPRTNAQSATDPLRVRGVIIEDARGRARVVLGPLDSPPSSSIRGFGLRINDLNGVERFGLSLKESGSVGMGFDAPPGKGDDRNRERINIVADENGGAFIRFLDRRTSVAARMSLDDQNLVWMEFADYMQKPPISRFIGLTGDKTVRGTP